MNKILKIALLFVIGVFAVILMFFFLAYFMIETNVGCDPPEKPANVPVSAVWNGGCDGGSWVELIDIKSDTIRFRIYNEWNGKLLLDADFVFEKCNDLQLTKANWSEYITSFDGMAIYTSILSDSKYCRLVPVYPAYHEEKIE